MPPRYIGLGAALVETLRRLGGEADLDTVLLETWRLYGPGSEVQTVMRLFRHPTGRVWSPEAAEALELLAASGVVELRGGRVRLRANVVVRDA